MAAETGDFERLERLPFETDAGTGARARIGLVALSSDYTIEEELRRVLSAPGVALFTARIDNDPEISPESLAAMGPRLTETAARLLAGDDCLAVVAYGCTSASTVLGEAEVARAIRAAKPSAAAVNPISAAVAALRALGARRIGVLTPYVRAVNDILRGRIVSAGFEVAVFGSFDEPNDRIVGAIDAASIRAAIRRIAEGRALDAVFVSCTSLRLVDAVAEIEAEIGVPVTSSNHALAWRCLRLAGVEEKRPELGRLFTI